MPVPFSAVPDEKEILAGVDDLDGVSAATGLDRWALIVPGMEQRISIVTLGVEDIARSRRFYEELGWCGQEVEETVFFQAGGQAVVLWGRDKLAADVGVADDGSTFGGIALAHNVRSRREVEELVDRAGTAGATITRTPGDTFYGGYAGCFQDPDGHVWEIAFNPGFPLGESGDLTLPPLGS
jgi:uncharacterized protein